MIPWPVVKRIFAAALEVPPAARREVVDLECRGDEEIRREVLSLLGSLEDAPAGFLGGTARLQAPDVGPEDEHLPGRVAGCRLLERLDWHGASATWRAELEEDREWAPRGRRVVVRAVRAGRASATQVARLRREAQVASAPPHPALVRAWESGRQGEGDEALEYVLLEDVAGRSLEDLAGELGPVAEPLLREIGQELSAALAALHARGIVHRGLHPSAVLLTDEPRVRLAGLGALFLRGEPRLTGEGDLVAAARHAAPELMEGGEPTPSCDVYALGVLLHDAATGRAAFPGSDVVAILRAQAEHRVARLRDVVPDISQPFDDLVLRMLSPGPRERPASAEEVRRLLS